MAGRISRSILSDLTRRVDKDRNNRIETHEGRVKGRVGNDNGIAGVQETADAIADGSAVLYGFQLRNADADAVADRLAEGDTWISKDDLNISDAARDLIDGQGGGSRDGRISRKEMAAALVRGGLAFNADGITLSSEIRINSGRPTPPPVDRPSPPVINDRPSPPPVNSGRPTPPPVDRPSPPPVHNDRPTPPPVHGGDDRPTPPPVHGGDDRPTPPPIQEPRRPPRYHFLPTYPVVVPTERRQIPSIPLPPQPQLGPEPPPARKVDVGEINLDVYQLLAEKGRLRTREKRFWIFTVHPKITAGQAKSLVESGKPIFVGPDGGWHGAGSYQQINGPSQLDSFTAEAKNQKLRELQGAEDHAYQGRVDAWRSAHQAAVRSWREKDIAHREASLLPFNSVYDTNRLMLNNFLVSAGGREFNRNLLTAMNTYNQAETRREIARRWHESPNISTSEFNMLVNAVLTQKISNLGFNAHYQGDWGTYLGTNPVPGLRYPDYPEDVDWNVRVIREVAAQVPMLLNSAVLSR